MLIIRLRRTGKKNKPTYRIVVAEHSFPVDGKFTADLGFYNPHTKNAGLKKDDLLSWMDKGAKPSNSVARILEREKIKHALVIVVKKNKKPKAKVEEAAKATPPANEPAATTTETSKEATADEATPSEEMTEEVVTAEDSSSEEATEVAEPTA